MTVPPLFVAQVLPDAIVAYAGPVPSRPLVLPVLVRTDNTAFDEYGAKSTVAPGDRVIAPRFSVTLVPYVLAEAAIKVWYAANVVLFTDCVTAVAFADSDRLPPDRV